MSFVSERERALILDLLRSRISEDEFHKQFPISPGQASAAGLAMLRRALLARDPLGVEFGLYLGHRFGISQDYLEALCALAGADWHVRHEDVIDGLAKLKAPASVSALYATALAEFPYRKYDEAYALAVKCIWILGAIQTVEAVERLGELLHVGKETVVSEARKQLTQIARSGTSKSLRELAQQILASHGCV